MFVVTSMGAGHHDVYFDVTWEIEQSISFGPPVYYTKSALMNTEQSAKLRAEAQAVADRLNQVIGADFDPHKVPEYSNALRSLAVFARDTPEPERSQQLDLLVAKLSALAMKKYRVYPKSASHNEFIVQLGEKSRAMGGEYPQVGYHDGETIVFPNLSEGQAQAVLETAIAFNWNVKDLKLDKFLTECI